MVIQRLGFDVYKQTVLGQVAKITIVSCLHGTIKNEHGRAKSMSRRLYLCRTRVWHTYALPARLMMLSFCYC